MERDVDESQEIREPAAKVGKFEEEETERQERRDSTFAATTGTPMPSDTSSSGAAAAAAVCGTHADAERPAIDISPSLLACNLARLAEEGAMVLTAGADSLHVDVMDGNFVPNISWGMPVVKCLHKELPNAFLDVHMMVLNPEQWVDEMAACGAGR